MAIKKEEIKQEVFNLYDDYAHNRLSRRDFMEKLSLYAVGGLTVPALMSFLMPSRSRGRSLPWIRSRRSRRRFSCIMPGSIPMSTRDGRLMKLR